MTVYFLFGKMLSLFWQICDIIGLIFIVANGLILKNNITIWSHWPLPTVLLQFPQRLHRAVHLARRRSVDARVVVVVDVVKTLLGVSFLRPTFHATSRQAVHVSRRTEARERSSSVFESTTFGVRRW